MKWTYLKKLWPGMTREALRARRRKSPAPQPRARLRLEELESRTVPTTITRTSTPIFYTNFSPRAGPALTSAYAAYQITNTDGVNYVDTWATIGDFTAASGQPLVTLGAHAADAINLGSLAPGETKTAFFYLRSTVSATNVAQTHTVSVFNGPPDSGSLLTSQNFSFSSVQSVINSSANKVTPPITISPPTPTLGGTFTITVRGQTGSIGTGNVISPTAVLDFTPAAYTSWRADAFQLTGTAITFSGPNTNTGTFTDTLLIPPTLLISNADTPYTAVYTFRVVGTTDAPEPVSPVAYISSGARVNHTDTGNFADLPSVQPPENFTRLDKTVAFTGPNTVTYTVTLTNSSAVDVTLDRIVDILPSSPADVTYVAGTALFDGTPIADPAISGQTVTFTNLFSVPAGSSRSLVFQAHFPDIAGTYTNLAVGFVGDVQIDTTLDTNDNAPARASFTVPSFFTTPIPGAVTLGTNGVILNDEARLEEGNAPTGTITFTLVGPGGGTLDTETVTVNGNDTYTTPTGFTLPTTGTVTGTYQWNAVYSGDANNAPSSDIGSLAEQVMVSPASPRLNTTPTLVSVGGTLQDSADLAGGYFPTGTITFTLVNPDGVTVDTEEVTVSGNGIYHTSVGFVANAAGIWHWVASYGGDPNNIAVSTGPLDEPVNVPEQGVPSLTTVPGPTTVTLGPEPVTLTDSALLGGELSPGGTITFTLVDPNGNTVHTEEVTVTGNGLYTTPDGFILPSDGSTVIGTYQWNISYSGDSFNLPISIVNDPTERVTVDPASPTVKTTADPSGTIPLNSSPVTLTDTATLESGYFPGGSITFTLDFNGVPVQGFPMVETVIGNGDYTASFTLPTTGAVTGTYTWHVHFSGDGNNNAADDQGDVHEQVIINPATPTLVTIASPAITLGTTAPTLSDTAELSGGYFPTGTLTFTLTGPGGFSFTDDVTVNGNGTYTTSQGNNPGGFTLPATGMVAGTYTWTVHYSGDDNNNAANDNGVLIEQTVVHPATPEVVTTADPTGTIQLGPTPLTLTDSAVLSGGYFPAGGILTFKLFFNDGETQTEVYTNNVMVNGNGTYTTSQGDNPGGFTLPTTGLVAGTYGWFVDYSGDDNNITADDQGGPDEQTVVTIPPIPEQADVGVTKTVDNPTPVFGTLITFTITVTNHGPAAATDVMVADPLPAGLTLIASAPSQGVFDAASGVWFVGTLANGASAMLHLTVQTAMVGPIVNNVVVRDDQSDPDLSNNQESEMIIVQPSPPQIGKRLLLGNTILGDPPPDPATFPQNAQFVAQLYGDLLHRAADPVGLARWSDLLDNGASRLQIVQGFQNSPEYRGDEVDAVYSRLLHRAADPAGRNSFVQFLENGGRVEQVEALIAGSPEYFQRRGGGTNDGFLNALYQDGLGRAVDAPGRAAWDQALSSGLSRTQVAAKLFSSPEYDMDLVNNDYGTYLRRPSDAAGLSGWVTLLLEGAGDDRVLAGILASDEYFTRVV
jgi:uncharacterized repeat protein (TIGR01451 family)